MEKSGSPSLDAQDPDFVKKRRVSIMLRGEYSPRDLFLHHEHQAIQDKMAALKEEGCPLTGGALCNHAASLLWTCEKQEEYASKVDPSSKDIAKYTRFLSSSDDHQADATDRKGGFR